jgi:hypothetical protein
VSSAQQLEQWDYDYSKLFYALDYKLETSFCYDYTLGTHVQHFSQSTGAETAKRLAAVNSTRIGRYASLPASAHPNPHYLEAVPSLNSYLLKMIAMGASGQL